MSKLKIFFGDDYFRKEKKHITYTTKQTNKQTNKSLKCRFS